jgi:hypothetical protein
MLSGSGSPDAVRIWEGIGQNKRFVSRPIEPDQEFCIKIEIFL